MNLFYIVNIQIHMEKELLIISNFAMKYSANS